MANGGWPLQSWGMRIVVCVKQVPDIQSERAIEGGRLVRGRDDVLNELDENAVEAAIALAEQLDATVVALTMGPPAAVSALRRSLQMGADAAVHVSDERLQGADVVVTARVLAAAIRKLGADEPVDLVVTGMTTMDGLGAMVPDALAAVLGLPALTLAAHVESDGASVSIRRTIGEATESFSAALPALVSVTDQANEPRIPNFKSMMAARSKPVTNWDLDQLALAEAETRSATAVVRAAARPPRPPGTIITDTGDAGNRLAAWLLDNKVV